MKINDMQKFQKEAVANFMRLTLDQLHPNWREYGFKEMKEIEDEEGDESPKFDVYAPHILNAYGMWRNIQIVEINV